MESTDFYLAVAAARKRLGEAQVKEILKSFDVMTSTDVRPEDRTSVLAALDSASDTSARALLNDKGEIDPAKVYAKFNAGGQFVPPPRDPDNVP